VHEELALGTPCVWILRADSNEERDALAADLHRQFTRAAERRPDPRFFDDTLPSAPPAELVRAITRGVVHIAGPTPPGRDPSVSVEDAVRRALMEPTRKDPRDDDPFYEIQRQGDQAAPRRSRRSAEGALGGRPRLAVGRDSSSGTIYLGR
jgi:hypothetical protein